jgi:type IV pilus assembly protein PilQ
MDIIVDPGVEGQITLELEDKTWQEAFYIICKMMKLTATDDEGFVYVMTEEEYRTRRAWEETEKTFLDGLAPKIRVVIRLSHADAEEIRNSLQEIMKTEDDQDTKLTVVRHTNSLVVYDTEKNIREIQRIIKELDVETPQIAISAKIIEVSSEMLHSLGMQWGVFGKLGTSDASAAHLPPSGNEGPLGQALERLTYGILSQDRFAFTLEYLFQEGDARVVAQPSITTVDNKQADIEMAERVRYFIPTTDGERGGVAFIDARTGLQVTPHVTDGKRISMGIRAFKESPVGENIRTQHATTTVQVNDGETVVIAGLTSNEENEQDEGIPFLKNLPVVGHLFKRSVNSKRKNDLLFFVTPHIIKKELDQAMTKEASAAPQTESSTDSESDFDGWSVD